MKGWAVGAFGALIQSVSGQPLIAQWETVGGGTSRFVRGFRMDTADQSLLIGGAFPYVQGNTIRANGIARWSGSDWSVDGFVDGSGDTTLGGLPYQPVISIAARGDTLFVGHIAESWHQDTDMGYAAMLVNGVWQPCGNPNSIFMFLEAEGRLFSGGTHDSLYNAYAPGIKEWRNGAFQAMPNMPFTSMVSVYEVTYWQGQFYFVGTFNALGSPRIIAFDGVDQWNPVGTGVGGGYFLEAVCGFGDSLYVGGFVQEGANVQSRHIQIWDGSSWKPFFPQVEFIDTVHDLFVHDGSLYVNGVHHWVGEQTQYGILRFDGRELCSIGGPRDNGASAMTVFQDHLYLANHHLPGIEYQFIGKLPLAGLVPDRCADVANTVDESGKEEGRLMVFPNPAHGSVTVRSPAPHSVVDLELVDAAGRVIRGERHPPAERIVLAVEELQPGSYLLVLNTNGARYRAPFIKQ